ncbi:GFA family protein [Paracoccaceae bacterium GXU_MW_L88]
MATQKGQCMCGAVTFTATDAEPEVHACHCEMCRRWTTAAFLAVSVGKDNLAVEGPVVWRDTSDWAKRGWCKDCGTPLFYRITAEGPMEGHWEVSMGAFDDPSGFAFTKEIFIDRKPGNFAFHGADRETMTAEQVFAMFGDL